MDLIAAPPSDAPRMQRSQGEVIAAWDRHDGATRLTRLRQAGSARAITLPGPEIVLLNTSGGLTGGDRLQVSLCAGAGTRITATTQTAERLYRARGGQAQIDIRLQVGAGARLDWLPQETILFQNSAATRRTTTELAADASCLSIETLILGRAAMGEQISTLQFRDERRFLRQGRLVHYEPLALGPDSLGPADPAGLAGARALAGLVFLAPGCADALGPVRALLDEPGVTAGASAFDGRLVVRLMAHDNWPLRRQMIRLLTVLRPSPLPRVWHS